MYLAAGKLGGQNINRKCCSPNIALQCARLSQYQLDYLLSAAPRYHLEGRHVQHVQANLIDVALLEGAAAAADPAHPAVDAEGRLGVGAVRAVR